MIISAPVAFAAAFLISPTVLCLGVFFVSSQLLLAMLFNVGYYMYLFYAAGCCVIFRQMLVHIFPLFFFWVASVAGLVAPTLKIPWLYIGGSIFLFCLSCKVLYMLILFFCVSQLYGVFPSWRASMCCTL